jgi:hypothetical protein
MEENSKRLLIKEAKKNLKKIKCYNYELCIYTELFVT